ncbi:MAG: type II toxin-antitoxin system Phd/YefM family antitoxin [Nocardiopsaceae bacterium]|nr:type II toxin-antitoxin system Phd/YefM family antitoxin [Nocardiopsaceae bacterium]
MTVLTMTEARATLPRVLDRVAAGEEVTITRRGKPVAVVMRPDIVRPQVRAEIVTGEGGFHQATRRRAAAGERIIGAAPMDVGDLLAELEEIRDSRA